MFRVYACHAVYWTGQVWHVPVRYRYCKCQMPFNPDKHMVECPSCQSWYASNLSHRAVNTRTFLGQCGINLHVLLRVYCSWTGICVQTSLLEHAERQWLPQNLNAT